MSDLGQHTSDAATTKLEESCLGYIGHRLFVAPFEGWGWAGRKPQPFRMALIGLERNRRQDLFGGYGRIELSGHIYDAMTVVFKPHYRGTWNFTTSVGEYNVYIYPELPVLWKEMMTEFRASEVPGGAVAAGYAKIEDEQEQWRGKVVGPRMRPLLHLILIGAGL